MPLAPGCRAIIDYGFSPGNIPSWDDLGSLALFPTTVCWGADAAGHGLLQADAALNATPFP
jgi:hypothetical protein